jgi:hypothetical protein
MKHGYDLPKERRGHIALLTRKRSIRHRVAVEVVVE